MTPPPAGRSAKKSRRSRDRDILVRLPADVVRRLEAVAARLSGEKPGMTVSRAAVIRMLVLGGLEREEAEGQRLKAKGRGERDG